MKCIPLAIFSFIMIFSMARCAAPPSKIPPGVPPSGGVWDSLEKAPNAPGLPLPESGDAVSSPQPAQDGASVTSLPEKARLSGPILPSANAYVRSLAGELAAKLVSPGMSDEEKIRAAYDWMVENVYFADPVGLDIWRYRCQPNTAPDYLENRALSVFLFQIGSCEDYAAAMTLLLRQMGFSAEYVSGLTLSAGAQFVDHAWTTVLLNKKWYHLDCHMDQLVTKDALLTYRYYLKSDREYLADHRWGSHLALYWSGQISQEQKAYILENMTPRRCPQAWDDPPGARTVSLPGRPDKSAVLTAIEEEKQAYIRQYGPLPTISLHTRPVLLEVMPCPPPFSLPEKA